MPLIREHQKRVVRHMDNRERAWRKIAQPREAVYY
jgi:hypothetical protein